MKHLTTLTLLAVIFQAAFAFAQASGPFSHIIIIVQENRTPDNLFGGGPISYPCGSEDPFEPGVDLQSGGYVNVNGQDKLQCPLSDFFGLWNGGNNPNPRPFVSITTPVLTNCFQYPVNCSTTPGMGSAWQPTPPDTE